MRLTILILITAILQVSANSFAQKITLSEKNASLVKVFEKIRSQSGYDFMFALSTINDAKPVNINVQDAELKEVLKQIFVNQPLEYTINEKSVVVSPKAPSFLERLAERWASIDVSGRVVDADGRGLPGASVSVKGKGGKAVSTGANGSFYLKGVDENAVLVMSFIGYVPKEIKAAKELGDIVIELSTSKLDEVQVIAYGTTTQRLSTGNVTTIKADVIEKQPVNNPLLALQGRVPGLFIEQATGFAGTGVKVRIQGRNSLNNGNDPFYVIDGIPFTSQLLPGGNVILGGSGGTERNTYGNPLSFINPSDIESIEVLKDADATAIYGSRAANGAILITTKKGKNGDTHVNLNLQTGIGKVPKKLDVMNSDQYLEMRKEALRNDGLTLPTPGPYGDSDLNGNWDNSRETDWQKELIGESALYQDLNASISGGGDRTNFLIGAGFHRETDVIPGDFSDRKASIRFNLNNASANQKFKTQFSGSYMLDNNRLPNIDLTEQAVKMAPVAPSLFNEDGDLNWKPDDQGNTTFFNPIAYLVNENLNKTTNIMSNMILSYEILDGLTFGSSFGYNWLSSDIKSKSLPDSFYPEFRPYLQRSTIFTDNTISSWTVEPQLTYIHKLASGKLEVLLGTTILQSKVNGKTVTAVGFSNDLVMDDIMSASTLRAGASIASLYKYNALFGKINYNWLDKYILNLTGRRDGSSRFGPKSQFHNFAAAGVAWLFTNERIIKDNLTFLSFGKVRASYGSTGSDQIGDYKTLSLYDPQQQDIPYQGIITYRPNGIANPYLEWEETRKMQIGFDLGFFKDKLLVNANYYRNQSSNQLDIYGLPATTGTNGIARNQAYKIRNSGWEFTMSSEGFVFKGVRWSSSLNLTLPKSLLVDYPDIVKTSAARTAIIGKPLTSQLLFHYLGVDPATGIYKFLDRNGNPTTSPTFEDATIIKDMAPKFYGGFQNTFEFKRMRLDFLFSFAKQIGQNYSFGSLISSPGNFNGGLLNQPVTVLNHWENPGDISSVQKFTSGNSLDQSIRNVYASDAGWKDASYIRLKNVSFSWLLPENFAKKLSLQNFSLFIQGQNLLTITSYNGLDPETKSSYTLPPLRVIVLGAKIGL